MRTPLRCHYHRGIGGFRNYFNAFFSPTSHFFIFFSTKEKAHFVGESQVIRLESKQQARAVERQKKAQAELRCDRGGAGPWGSQKSGVF